MSHGDPGDYHIIGEGDNIKVVSTKQLGAMEERARIRTWMESQKIRLETRHLSGYEEGRVDQLNELLDFLKEPE